MTTTDANGKGHLITGPSLQRARERFHAQLVEAGKTLDDAYQQMLAAVGAEELSRMHERFKEALGERR
ncbi:hypothetical protein [Paracraurococcus lichenis]|uniref:Uncharacterized protein n=1 Tax=Paracraurococcus lichenis TaxID=3064888 RepID=A0ABT9E714_9PROT|nr:hypothetical protein [Paracraurococcus sp. LOR1-02]MDO9711977.1 hypothetical protein [Paracraurococcus sp. LOR1-02]